MAGSDERIKRDVVDSLYWDDRLDASNIQVSLEDGRVSLTGSVPSLPARQAAVDDALAISGVRSVECSLEVQHPPETTVPSDFEIRERTEQLLKWSPDLDVASVNVSVQDGRVSLEGTMDAYWKKHLAERLARNVAGVTAVENKLAITPKGDYLDKEIAAEITAAMDRSPLLEPGAVNVRVEKGAVTLTGTAPTWASRGAAYEAALYTPGVAEIHDYIDVAAP